MYASMQAYVWPKLCACSALSLLVDLVQMHWNTNMDGVLRLGLKVI